MYAFFGGNVLCTAAAIAGSFFSDMTEEKLFEDEKELACGKSSIEKVHVGLYPTLFL